MSTFQTSSPRSRSVAVAGDRHELWAGVAVVCSMFDGAATGLWLTLGIASEGNPLIAWLIEVVGIAPAMVLRTVVSVGLIVALAALTEVSIVARRALPVLTVALGAVAAWHVIGAATVLA